MKSPINPKNFFYLGRWMDNVLDTDFWSHWNESDFLKEITLKPINGDRISIDGHFFHSKEMQMYISTEAFQKAEEKDFEYFENYNNVAIRCVKVLKKTSVDFSKRKNITAKELREFFDKYESLFAIWMIMFPISEGLKKSLLLKLKRYDIDIEEIDTLFKPIKDTEIIKQHKEIKRIVKIMAKNGSWSILKQRSVRKVINELENDHPQIYHKIEKHLEKYSWVGMHHFWGSPMKIKNVIEELRSESLNYPFAEKVIEEIIVPKDVQKDIDIMNMLTYWRNRCAELSGFIIFNILPQLKNVSKRLGVKYKDLVWFNRNEIIRALSEGNRLNKKTADIRSEGFAYVSAGNNEDEIIVGKEMSKLLNEMRIRENNNIQIKGIKGVSASKGEIVRGRVRIVMEPSDSIKFRKNEILVAPETTPDFILAMKKAAAIITDLGGLTSHAAIVARELQKPCIIATKIATQVLKDGDLVEVDADKGIVRIIKSNL